MATNLNGLTGRIYSEDKMTTIPSAFQSLNFDSSTDALEEFENSVHDCIVEEPTTPMEKFIENRVNESMIPKIGMEFESEETAYDFYNVYAEKLGFSIRRSRAHTSKTGVILDRVFVCSCEGVRMGDKRDDDVKQHRPQTRFGCLARMGVSSRADGKYRVFKFISEHSHTLVSPSRSHFLRSHRDISEVQKKETNTAQSSSIAPKASMDLKARQVGGRHFLRSHRDISEVQKDETNMAQSSSIAPKASMDLKARQLCFIPVDCRNYLRTKATVEMKVGDTGGVLEYLQKMQSEDPGFTCAIQVDVDDKITNIFWADARMKVDYDRFGDVVSFDTTYRKNKEGRPLSLFLGVNHHKQTIIFGAALLYDETKSTFEWLFDTFATTMSGKKPKTILTDQDAAMDNALSTQWPETKHRLCVWHMYQNATKHLNGVFAQFKSFAKDLGSCVYDYDEVSDFVDAWNNMLAKYNLEDNYWLKNLYKNKEKWALVYGRQTFCADMSTTQRIESMNSKVKDYISYKNDLFKFFQNFQSLLEDLRYNESRADIKSSTSIPTLPYLVEILKHAADVYTLEVFKLFYQEVWKTWNCNIEICKEVGTTTEYKVTPEKPHPHIVKFDSKDLSVMCSCMKFEFVGILCAHALKVFSLKSVKRVPDRYILKRWTKTAKVSTQRLFFDGSINDNPKAATGKRYKELSRLFNQLAARAAEMQETYEVALEGHSQVLKDIEEKIKSLYVAKEIVVPLDDGGTEKLGGSQVEGLISTDPSSALKINEPTAKGIKVKPKKKRSGPSKRYQNALDRDTAGKRKISNKYSRVGTKNAIHDSLLYTQENPIIHQQCFMNSSALPKIDSMVHTQHLDQINHQQVWITCPSIFNSTRSLATADHKTMFNSIASNISSDQHGFQPFCLSTNESESNSTNVDGSNMMTNEMEMATWPSDNQRFDDLVIQQKGLTTKLVL